MGGKLHIGAILHLYCSITTPPKNKFLVVVCLDPKPLLVFINSKINIFVQRKPGLAQCQILIDAKNHTFLDYNSCVDCSDVCSFPIDHLEEQVRDQLNLEKSLGSRKSTQALGAPDKPEKLLITNKVTTNFSDSPCTPISCMSFSRPTDFSRLKGTVSSGILSRIKDAIQKSPLISPRQLSWIAQAMKD